MTAAAILTPAKQEADVARFQPNTLYYRDNLEVLRDFPPECVDLVYLDPPFNSNRSYNVLFKESKSGESEAPIGVLVVTQKPTSEMVRDAAAAGVYHSPWDRSTYPRIQIITAGEIVQGRPVDMSSKRGTSDFTRARPSAERAEKPRLLSPITTQPIDLWQAALSRSSPVRLQNPQVRSAMAMARCGPSFPFWIPRWI